MSGSRKSSDITRQHQPGSSSTRKNSGRSKTKATPSKSTDGQFRVETDSLGEVKVAADRLWGAQTQVLETREERFAALREFYPNVKEDDWRVEVAGQRVQIIKKDPTHGGILEFGTELVSAADGSIIAMLGASPGASTAVWIMLEVVKRCFPKQLANGWSAKLKEMIPSYGQSVIENAAFCDRVRAYDAPLATEDLCTS